MWKYSDIKRGVSIEYGLTRTRSGLGADMEWTYGIEAEMYVDGKPTGRASVDDAFCTRPEAESFIMLLAENGVEPCHLEEVIVDKLSC